MLASALPANGLAKGHLIEPVDRAKATNVAVTHWLQHPEVEVVGLVVVGGVREIAVVALGSRFDSSLVDQLVRFGHHGQAPYGLHILSLALTHQQRTLGVFLQVVGVLGDSADEDQRVAVGIGQYGTTEPNG